MKKKENNKYCIFLAFVKYWVKCITSELFLFSLPGYICFWLCMLKNKHCCSLALYLPTINLTLTRTYAPTKILFFHLFEKFVVHFVCCRMKVLYTFFRCVIANKRNKKKCIFIARVCSVFTTHQIAFHLKIEFLMKIMREHQHHHTNLN